MACWFCRSLPHNWGYDRYRMARRWFRKLPAGENALFVRAKSDADYNFKSRAPKKVALDRRESEQLAFRTISRHVASRFLPHID